MKNHSRLIFLLLALIFSVPAIIGILHPGFPLTDDGNWMIIRFSAFFQTLRDGEFPVRFLMRLNNGYGYPVADFLYPLFMYVGVPIHLFKFNFVDTIKIIFAGSMLFSSIFCFLWLRKLFDNVSSLIGSIVYALFPYHLWDMYKRGSVGEVLALSIVPFIFWQLERKSLIWTAIGIALLILAHNTIAVIFLPIVILYMALDILIAKDKVKLLYQDCAEIILGFCLSAFFWIPAIYDLQYTVFSKTQVSDWSKYFSDMSLIGLSTFIIIILTFVLILAGKIDFKKHRLTFLLLIICVVSIFLSTSMSAALWNILPVSFIQFPFRFLSLAVFCASFLAACVVSVLRNKSKILISFTILFLVFLSAWPFLMPKEYQYYPDSFYSTNQDSTTVKNEYMPKWVKKLPDRKYNSAALVLNGQEKLNILEVTPNKVSIQAYFAADRIVQINTVYFPGWEVKVDGQQVPIDYNSNGLIRISVSSGSHTMVSTFGETRIRILADVISLSGFVLVAFLLLKQKYKKL